MSIFCKLDDATYIAALHVAAIIPAAEECGAASMIGISWNTWFLEVGLYYCVALGDELEDYHVSRVGGQVVRRVLIRLIAHQDGMMSWSRASSGCLRGCTVYKCHRGNQQVVEAPHRGV